MLRCAPRGETRYSTGSLPTQYQFTGQKQAEIGLYDYGARWYDPQLGRWIQPDSIVPDAYNPNDWDRFSYVRNNPVNNTDPTGHMVDDFDNEGCYNCKPRQSTGSSQPQSSWEYIKKVSAGFHIGPKSDAYVPDYYSDYLNDPTLYCYNAFCAGSQLADLATRFYHPGPKLSDDNFWVDFEVKYQESAGIIVSDLTIVNYYKDKAKLIMLSYSNGPIEYISPNTNFYLDHGFGSDFIMESPSQPFDGSNPVILNLKVAYYVELGNGPQKFVQNLVVGLPSLPATKYYLETGKILPNPLYPFDH